ncbi:hypothetical protein [Deefgea sp. CFH1-16]|uniref:hypothetical protein n=1 Tax=Deefgea sp. CFH1-16 TaxID=2675457 RepID=UPI00194031CF|nr:hypothetical protein [Deefgea sp. CFH1-16]
MVRRLHPLQAFLDSPGIVVCTASKAQVAHKVFDFDDTKGTFRWQSFENLPLFLEELNRDDSQLGRRVSRRPDSARVVTFVDEEEDSYWYLFDQRKSIVNSEGRNDLNIVITEFFTLFDLKWPLAFEGRDGQGISLAKKVYEHLEEFAQVSEGVYRDIAVAQKNGPKYVPNERRIAIFRKALADNFPKTEAKLSDAELLKILQELLDKNDVQNKFKRFQQKARVLALLRGYIAKITPQNMSSYEKFRELRDLVFDKKFFTMNRSTYGEVLDQPGQTFFNESASVIDTEFLSQIELRRDTADQTIRLIYHENETPQGVYTLLYYLELVLFIARVLAVRGGDNEAEFTKFEIERYSNLYNFRNDIRRLFKDSITTEGIHQDTSSDELLADDFFFNKTKSVVTLEESRRQADEYNLPADVSLTLTITTLRATPEEDIVRALGRTNGVYLMSATGGLSSASSGAFNTKQLRRIILEKNGFFDDMSEEELNIVAEEALKLVGNRERQVTILNDGAPATGFGVSSGYRGLIAAFKSASPKKGDSGYSLLNQHKLNEIEGLVASLDRLLSSSIRSGLVLCQTVSHIQKCLIQLSNQNVNWIQQKTPNHFVIKTNYLPAYRNMGNTDDITLILLYNAQSFPKKRHYENWSLK